MSELTLREALAAARDELDKPTLALFTTFNFDPVFFEDYVLPVLLPKLDASTMRGQIHGDQALRDLPTAVFYDADQLVQGRKRLSYGTVPVRDPEYNFFHPKLILLGNDEGEFRLIVTSANLTTSGWGRHQEVVTAPIAIPRKSNLSLSVYHTLDWLLERAERSLTGITEEKGWFDALTWARDQLSTTRRRHEAKRWLVSTAAADQDDTFLANLARYADDRAATCLTIYSPYFTKDLSALVDRVRGELGRPELRVLVVPALERTREGTLRIGICTDEVAKERSYEVMKVVGDDGDRFRHAKIMWLEGTKRRHLVCVGSHNFTKPALAIGLGKSKPNVEASVMFPMGEASAYELLDELTELEPLDFAEVETKSAAELDSEAPGLSAFSCSVIADWKTREFRLVASRDQGITIKLPGLVSFELSADHETAPFADSTDRELRRCKFFRAWPGEGSGDPLVGLICEINWERFRLDGAVQDLSDYIDIWRAQGPEEVSARSQRKQLRLPYPTESDDEDDAIAELAKYLDKSDHLSTLYGLLGGFIELRRHLDAASDAEEFIIFESLLWSAPHSLNNFVATLEGLSDSQLPPVRRWVLYTESRHLLSHPAVADLDDEVRQRLSALDQRLAACCLQIEEQTPLHPLDEPRFGDKARLFAWFRDQLGPGFDDYWQGRP